MSENFYTPYKSSIQRMDRNFHSKIYLIIYLKKFKYNNHLLLKNFLMLL